MANNLNKIFYEFFIHMTHEEGKETTIDDEMYVKGIFYAGALEAILLIQEGIRPKSVLKQITEHLDELKAWKLKKEEDGRNSQQKKAE